MSDRTPNLPHKLEIPPGTRDKLAAFRKRVWKIKLIEGICAAAFGLLLSYLTVFVLDRFIDTPAWLRALLLIGGTTGFGIWLPIKCHRWIWKTRRFDQLARLLKQRMPRLSDRMLGIIELAQNELEQQRSAVLCQAALRQVDEDIRDQSFDDAVPNPRHRTWAWVVAVPIAISLLALIVVPAAGTNALSRWLLPWRHTERYTFVQLDQLPDQLVVPYSEEFSLTAPLSDETAWAPGTAVARIGQQPAVEAPRRADNAYAFALPPQQADARLLVAAGDARKTINVEPKLRPEITELVAKVKLPEYLQYSSELTKDARGGSLSLVKGSAAMLVATASRELRSAMLDGMPQQIEAGKIQTRSTLLNDSKTLELSWTDQYGLTAKQPFKLSIQADEDAPPSVVCSELGRQQVVLVDQVLTFEINADDDFGLKQIGLEWTGVEDPLLNPNPVSGELLILGGAPESKELTAKATFCAAREGIQPQTLQLRIFTLDYYPTRERVYSPPYTLFVLSPEDHANWLTAQMQRWSRQAQEVYERENQLYETNKELRRLSSAELDAPKNRQRLETQAAAEITNARRLTAVSAAGKQIIKEAARNDQFNVMTMEGLAEMVKTLDEMAASRMPSVADLLKKAATARSGGDAQKPGEASDAPPGDSQPSAPQVGNNRDPNNSSEGKANEGDDSKSSKPVPSISDIESSMNKPDDKEQEEDEQGGKQQAGSPKFGLPSTTVLGGGVPQQQQQQEPPTAEENLDEAIAEQEDLLDEFAKVAEELQKILDNLEGSTFVKRLKATSRRHLKLASELNESLSDNFGRRPSQLTPEQRETTVKLAEQERLEAENVMTVKQDLEAYYNRVQQGKFKTVINEMDELTVVAKLETLSELVSDNLHGQSIAHAEYWADTLDRWAEQLVGPGDPSGGSAPGSKGGSLSPAIVLDVMKILDKEIGLREETRSAEQVRDALDVETYSQRANGLANTQHEIAEMTAKTTMAIVDLEKEKNLSFPKELQLLNAVSSIMQEVEAILAEPNTGPEAIAAETEIIELLLQVQRQQPPKKSSKGAAGENPNGGGEGDTEESALALIGRGDELNAGTVQRDTAQATGTSGTAYPAEFRAGLDAYFSDLEK